MLFLQQAPAETTGYMIAGYVVILGIMLIYLISLKARERAQKRNLQILQELERKDE
jgi:hypothetical protein